jgi:hypothetical protein
VTSKPRCMYCMEVLAQFNDLLFGHDRQDMSCVFRHAWFSIRIGSYSSPTFVIEKLPEELKAIYKERDNKGTYILRWQDVSGV